MALIEHHTGEPPELNDDIEGVPILADGLALARLGKFLDRVAVDLARR